MKPGTIYSFVNSLGDVAMFTVRRGKVRELVMHANGTTSLWTPAQPGMWAAWHVGETSDEGAALAWVTEA